MSEPKPRGTPLSGLSAGARFGGKYRLLRRVAVGGMGEVWRARNEATDADVALKVVRGHRDATMGARLRNEARLGATLTHRSIVRIFDLLEEPDGTFVLVMELLRGESLAGLLERRGTIPEREAVAVAVPVLSALAHAHESGIVHRDVTPANIFLAVDPDGHVTPKLVDFGIAKLPSAGSHTLPGSVLGTPRYMSPEQIRGAEELDGRSDLFSVGAVLYEMMTGASPFDAPTPAASLALVLESPVDPDPSIAPRLWVDVARSLAKRPYERHSGAKEMADALCTATGENEASLAALLRREAPSREEVDAGDDAEPPSDRVTSVEGQSLEAQRRPRSRAGWVVGLAVAAFVAVVVEVAGLRPLPNSSVPARTGQGAEAPPPKDLPRPVPTPAAAEPSAARPETAPAASHSAEAPRRTSRPVPRPERPAPRAPSGPTPIATTPGF